MIMRNRFYGALVAVFLFILPAGAQGQPGTVIAERKVSSLAGGFGGALDDSDQFGISLAGIGDLDGDMIPDLAAGASGDDDGGTARGAVWILFLNSDGSVKAEQKISDLAGGFTGILNDGESFGSAVASIGDLDGDLVTDLVVGAEGTAGLGGPGARRGGVWILFMNTNGTVKAAQAINEIIGGFTGTLDNFDEFGGAVASIGDIDGDSIPDIAVGAVGDDDGNTGGNRGAVWILFLNTNGTVKGHQKISDTEGGLSPPFTLQDLDFFGSAIAGLGDLDGDGVPDIAVGAEGDDGLGSNRGAVYTLFLNPGGTVKGRIEIRDGLGGFDLGTLGDLDQFGGALAATDDINGDGIPELAVGARFDGDGGQARGAVWVLFMGASGSTIGYQKISDTQGGFGGTLIDLDMFGGSVAAPGDLNGDGSTDLASGAIGDDDGGSQRGAVWNLLLEAPPAAPTPTVTPAPSPTATTTPSPDPTASPSADATATPSAVATATPSPEATPTASPSSDATATPSADATATPSPTLTPDPSPTATPFVDPSATPSPDPSPTVTATPSPEASATPSPDATATPFADPSATPSPDPSTTATATPSPEASATPSADASATPSPFASPTIAPTPSPAPTPTPSPDATATASPVSVTATASAVPTATPGPTVTPCPQAATLLFTLDNAGALPIAQDRFGQSVTVTGNNIAAGAPGDDAFADSAGAVHVFDALTGGFVRTHLNPDFMPFSTDNFGAAVAGFGTDLAVSSPGWEPDRMSSPSNVGRVYVFDSGGNLDLNIDNPDPQSTAMFGSVLAGEGRQILIGVPLHDTGGTNNVGIVYLYDRDFGTFVHTFGNPSPNLNDQFGSALALSENYVIIGCKDNALGGTVRAGTVYVYSRSTGVLLHTIDNPEPAPNNVFGDSVAGSGDLILIGAPFNDGVQFNSGVAYVYDAVTGGQLLRIPNPLEPAFAAVDDHFGDAVAFLGSDPVVSATGDTNEPVRLFDGTTGALLIEMFRPGPDGFDENGAAIATFGADRVVSGAALDDTLATVAGQVYVFSAICPDPATPTPAASPSPTAAPTSTPTAASTMTPTPTATPCCPGDANNSGGAVNANDFLAVQANFGLDNGVGGLGDANCSGGAVNANDFLAVQANFGASCG